MTHSIDDTLSDRGKSYGSFEQQARTSEGIKDRLHASPNWPILMPDQREAMDMIAVKLGRLLTGDPNHYDSWLDLQGYAKLVADRIFRDRQDCVAKTQAESNSSYNEGIQNMFKTLHPRPMPPPTAASIGNATNSASSENYWPR